MTQPRPRFAPIVTLTALALALWGAAARADEPVSAQIRISASDTRGTLIRTAAVLLGAEAIRRPVDVVDAAYVTMTIQDVSTGTPFPLIPGKPLDIYVSAPGYRTEWIQHTLTGNRKRDAITIPLMPLSRPSLWCLPAGKTLDALTSHDIAEYARRELADPKKDDATKECLHAMETWGWLLQWQLAAERRVDEIIAGGKKSKSNLRLPPLEPQELDVIRAQTQKAALAWATWAIAAGRDANGAVDACRSAAGRTDSGCDG